MPPLSFGAKNRFAGRYEGPSYGGFNLGNPPPIQSSVATPNPAAAGVSGQPPMGGMAVGQWPDEQEGGGTSPSTPTGNANVTGLNPGLVGAGVNFATTLAGLPGLGSVVGPAATQLGGPIAGLIASLLSDLGAGAAKSAAINASVPSNMTDASGNPVNYAGSNFLGLPTGSLYYANSPDLSNPLAVPDVAPNQFARMGDPTGVEGEAVASHTAGGRFGYPSNDPTNNPFHPDFRGYPTPQPDPEQSDVPDATFPTLPDVPNYPDIDVNFLDAPAPATSDTGGPPSDSGQEGNTSSGVAPDTGNVGVVGESGVSGTGVASGVSDGGVAGVGDAWKHGGKIKRPDPKKLAARLKAGNTVNAGKPNSRRDDVPVNLQHGEFVVDRDSTRKYEPVLRAMNAEEPKVRGKGGMHVSGFGRR